VGTTLFFVVVAGIVAMVGYRHLSSRYGSREAADAWSKIADEFGLDLQLPSMAAEWSMRGEVGGVPIEVKTVTRRVGKSRVRYTQVEAGGGRLGQGVVLCSEGVWQGLRKAFKGEDIQLRDPEFDNAVCVSGREVAAVAMLNDMARRRVIGLVNLGAQVREGSIAYEERGVMADQYRIHNLLKAMLSAAPPLQMEVTELPTKLAENGLRDPNEDVRVRNMSLLVRHYPGRGETREACLKALGDVSVRVRLVAASALPEEGFSIIKTIAEAEIEDSEVRADAIAAITEFGVERARPTLAQTLRSRQETVRRATISAIGKLRDEHFVESLCKLTKAGTEKTLVALTKTFATLGDGRAEPALVGMLTDPSVEVKKAAAHALGSLGSVHSMQHLLPFTKGLLDESGLKSVAKIALAKIQTRIGDSGDGRLSIVEHEVREGALSLVAESGQLGLVEESAEVRQSEEEEEEAT